eukprot:5550507-Amphidinium_carterae.4
MSAIEKIPPTEKREADLREVLHHMPQLPKEFQLALLTTRVKEMSLASDLEASQWIERINPGLGTESDLKPNPPHGLSAQTPTEDSLENILPRCSTRYPVSPCHLGSPAFTMLTVGSIMSHDSRGIEENLLEKGKIFQKLWCKEGLFRLVGKGALAAAAMELLCQRLRKLVKRVSEGEPSLVMQVAYKESLVAAEGILVLCGACPEECDAITTLGKLQQSKDSSTLSLRQTLTQTPYWRERERRVCSQNIAIAELRPQLDQAGAVLAQEDAALNDLIGIAARLSLWSETLPKGALRDNANCNISQSMRRDVIFVFRINDFIVRVCRGAVEPFTTKLQERVKKLVKVFLDDKEQALAAGHTLMVNLSKVQAGLEASGFPCRDSKTAVDELQSKLAARQQTANTLSHSPIQPKFWRTSQNLCEGCQLISGRICQQVQLMSCAKFWRL